MVGSQGFGIAGTSADTRLARQERTDFTWEAGPTV